VIRVVVADDQHLVRTGLRSILSTEPDLLVVGEAPDGRAAAALAREQRADVVLMDVQMPGTDGIEGTRLTAVSRPEARVLMLTMFDLDEHVLGALREGASGFLLKTTSPPELTAAVRAVHRGDLLFSPSITRRLIEAYVTRPAAGGGGGVPPQLRALTVRELEVYHELALGRSNTEVAQALHLGENTVKTHVARILAKLGLRDRVQAVVLAYECGLIAPGS
jgi:DNA-binding NarL/FixJ family response regulator